MDRARQYLTNHFLKVSRIRQRGRTRLNLLVSAVFENALKTAAGTGCTGYREIYEL